MGVRMTTRDAFYTRDQYQQLVFASLGDVCPDTLLLEPPAVLKPAARWTGKQLITTLLKNLTRGRRGLNLDAGAKINNHWAKGSPAGLEGELKILVRDGHFLSGILDKNQIGTSKHGLVHACFELCVGLLSPCPTLPCFALFFLCPAGAD